MKQSISVLKSFVAILSVFALPVASQGSVTLTGSSYTENFDGDLGAGPNSAPFSATIGVQSLIPGTTGWEGAKIAGTGAGAMPYTIDTGGGNSGSIYSYGSTIGNPVLPTVYDPERALGSVASGSNTPAYGVEIINNNVSIIDGVSIAYIAEFWRSSTSNTSTPNTINFKYFVGSSSNSTFLSNANATAFTTLNIVGPPTVTTNGPLNGNLPANQSSLSGSITGLTWTPGTSLYLIWQDTDDVQNDAGLAVDNFSLNANLLTGVKPYWDVNGAGTGKGGTGTWDAVSPNWNDFSGTATPSTFDAGHIVIFSGTAGTVTVSGTVSPNGGIQFESAYTVTGGTISVGSANSVSVINAADTATISSIIAGTSGVTKTGGGTLVLSGTNTFSKSADSTTAVGINGGVLSITSDANLGDVSNGVSFGGGVLKIAGTSLTTSRPFIGSAGGFDVASGNTLTLNGGVSTSGVLTLSNAGTVTIASGPMTTGGLAFSSNGTLEVGVGGSGQLIISNSGNATITATNATGTTATIKGGLSFTGLAPTIARLVNVANSGATLEINGPIQEDSRVAFTGPGTVDLKGANANATIGFTLGNVNLAGPVVKVKDSDSLGPSNAAIGAPATFFNSGTIFATTPIVFGSKLANSVGGQGSFPAIFAGGAMEFQGTLNLFRASGTGANKITANTPLTFSGGWGLDTGTTTNTTGGVIFNGSSPVTISNTSGGSFANLIVPITADGTTVTFNGVNPNISGTPNFNGVTNQTVNLGLSATNNGKLNLVAANAFAGSGIATAAKVVVSAGGTVGTGGVSQTFNTLTVTGGGKIDLGSGSGLVQFASSSAAAWTGNLIIKNWNGSLAGGGTDQVSFDSAGLLPAQRNAVHFSGYLTGSSFVGNELVPASATQLLLGDLNQDSHVNTADISAMFVALTDLTAYKLAHVGFDDLALADVADLNGDGAINNIDVQGLLDYLRTGHGSTSAVPEPSTLALGALGALGLAATLRNRRKKAA